MERILKDDIGRIWLSPDGKVIKERPFQYQVIQEGLIFWGQSEQNYLTIVDGLVSEAYDIRGNGLKMVQATVSNRPTFFGNSIGIASFSGIYRSIRSNFTSNVKSLFFITKRTLNPNDCCIGTTGDDGLRSSNYMNTYTGTFYRNLSKFSANNPATINTFYIVHSVSDFNKIAQNISLYNTNGAGEVVEWGWYNRVLNEAEVIYNINALNAKHGIF